MAGFPSASSGQIPTPPFRLVRTGKEGIRSGYQGWGVGVFVVDWGGLHQEQRLASCADDTKNGAPPEPLILKSEGIEFSSTRRSPRAVRNCYLRSKKLHWKQRARITMALRFHYNPRKAAQAAAFLVRLNGGQMDTLSLIKILYLSDRKSLTERGRPITGDAMVSMPHGPVLSRIYDEIKTTAEEERTPWYELLTERNAHVISLREENPPTDELSQFERDILAETHGKYARYGPMDLRNLTHHLPEYIDPQGSSLQIDPATILRQEGWSDAEIDDVRMSAQEEVFFNEICR